MPETKSDGDDKDKKGKDAPTVGKAWDHLKGAFSGVSDVMKSGESLLNNLKALDTAGDVYGVNVARLSMTEAEFDKLIEPVLAKAGESAKRYKSKFGEYRSAVNALHARGQRYKALLADEAQLLAGAQGARSQIRRIRAMHSAKKDPTLAEYKSYLQSLYSDLKVQILDLLYEEHRAACYATLDDRAFPGTSDQTIGQLQATHVQILGRINERLKMLGRPTQKVQLELEWTREEYPELLASLENSQRVLLAVNRNDPRLVGQFGGKSNIRVTRCRVILPGATTRAGSVYVSLTHTGAAQFLDHNSAWQTYCHKPLHAFFQQAYDRNGKPEREIGGGEFDDGAYIQVSPFTVWSIKLPSGDGPDEELNVGLSLKGVTSIRLLLDCKTEAKIYAL